MDKEIVILAVQRLDNGRTGNIGLRQIEDFGKDTFEQAVDEMTVKGDGYHYGQFLFMVGIKKGYAQY